LQRPEKRQRERVYRRVLERYYRHVALDVQSCGHVDAVLLKRAVVWHKKAALFSVTVGIKADSNLERARFWFKECYQTRDDDDDDGNKRKRC